MKHTVPAHTKALFEACADMLRDRGADLPGNLRIRICDVIDHEKAELAGTWQGRRTYAHALHHPGQVCVSSDFADLPVKHQRGIIVHELGHVITEGDEKEADKYLFDNYGIEIKYDNDLELQYIGGKK